MANILGTLIGAALGALIAMRRGGNRLDILHYAGVLGLIGLVVGTFVGVFILRGA
ncbi:hypothetical protein [Nioella nitratireducens]|uniref:hypothetical protein n=1 Tax=Nioella nitratireducens TaxID=1287720 RepID=UPI0018F51A43|nr:hypothetical protein [Nioella nitratireducens]